MSGNGRDGSVHDADWSGTFLYCFCTVFVLFLYCFCAKTDGFTEDTPPFDPNLCVLFDLMHSTELSSRDFDGASDYVYFNGPIGAYDIVTIDTWVKWHTITGNHPIMNEDNWDIGDLHYQM